MKEITKLKPNQIFIFGSNGNGDHAGGAALQALKFGAVMGQARGLQGQTYAIETLNKKMEKVSLASLKKQFKELWKVARQNPDKEFLLTKVGCGIAGFDEPEVRDCFNSENVPSNVVLPVDWRYKRLWKSMPADMAPHGHKFEVGNWYYQKGKIEACKNGYHASNKIIDAMGYVDCKVLALVEVRGDCDIEGNKEAWQQMRLIETHEWTKEQSVKLAIYASEMVIDIYEKLYPNDRRPRKAIEAAQKWLKNPTEKNRDAAEVAARAAARAAAEAASWAAITAEAAIREAASWAAITAEAAIREAASWAAAQAAAEAATWAAIAVARADSWAIRAAARADILDKIEKYIQTELLNDFTHQP